MQCKCGKEFNQAEYDGDLPNFCQNCGHKINSNIEMYLNVDVDHSSHADPKYIFVTGRVKGKKVDFRFDTETTEIRKFPEHMADMEELSFLRVFLIHYGYGRIKIFGKFNR